MSENKVTESDSLYNDLEKMKVSELLQHINTEDKTVPIAVENASLEVKNIAIHITKTSGGNGAFREAVEWIIDQQGRKEEIIEMMQKRLLDS